MILELLLLINSLRITPLELNTNLSHLAFQRAKIVYADFSHNNWKKTFERTNCSYIGENLAKGFTSPTELTKAMLKSPTHKHAMLNENYTIIGIGQYKNIVVELYCGQVANSKIVVYN
jgi:uncharacterized protein YkwD